MSDNPFVSAAENPFAGGSGGGNDDFGNGMAGDNPFQLDDSVNDTSMSDSLGGVGVSVSEPLSDPSVTAFTSTNTNNAAAGGPSWASSTGFNDTNNNAVAPAETAPVNSTFSSSSSMLPPWMSGVTQQQSSAS